jgi:hypothetical protein
MRRYFAPFSIRVDHDDPDHVEMLFRKSWSTQAATTPAATTTAAAATALARRRRFAPRQRPCPRRSRGGYLFFPN